MIVRMQPVLTVIFATVDEFGEVIEPMPAAFSLERLSLAEFERVKAEIESRHAQLLSLYSQLDGPAAGEGGGAGEATLTAPLAGESLAGEGEESFSAAV